MGSETVAIDVFVKRSASLMVGSPHVCQILNFKDLLNEYFYHLFTNTALIQHKKESVNAFLVRLFVSEMSE